MHKFAQITRLINKYQTVISYTRKKDDRLSWFASRFRRLAGRDFRFCGAFYSSQTGQVFAITLLNSALIDEVVLTNAKMQLISLAQAHAKKEEEENAEVKLTVSAVEPALSLIYKLKDVCDKDATVTVNGRKMLSRLFVKNISNKTNEL